MRNFMFWSSCLALSLQAALGCGSDLPPAIGDSSQAGSAGTHANKPIGSVGATGGALGGAPDSEAEAGSAGAGLGEGGAAAGMAGSDQTSGGADLAGAASGGAPAEAPPFVCDRDDIVVPLATWWASYCLAKASTRSCSADFDECYASTKGFLESGLCTDDDDSSKLEDLACAAAALAYSCEPPIAAEMGCAAEPPRAEFLDEACRGRDAELAARISSCNPK